MTLLPLHITAGSLAIVAGGVALYAAKGGKIHRQSGVIFVCAMLAMTISAVIIGALGGHRVNTSQGALTCYLVASGYAAVNAKAREMRWVAVAGMAFALCIGAYDMMLGAEAMARPRRTIDGVPGPMMFMFGGIAFMAAVGDFRFMRGASLPPRYRIGRHLWRMCLGLWIATASFFLGQAKFIPEPLRITPLLAVPVLLVFGAMIYWIVRVSIRHKPWVSRQAGA